MPASTSSKTSVALPSALATPMSASMTRDSSPPDAISRSGPAGAPAFGAMRNSTASAPVGPGSPGSGGDPEPAPAPPSRARLEPAVEAPARPPEGARPFADRRPQPRRRLRPRRRQLGRALLELRPRRLELRGCPLERHLGAGQLVAPRAAALGVGQHRGDRAAVLALEPLEHRQ